MKNIDWKSIGVMAGIALAVYLGGTIVHEKVVKPAQEKAKAKKAANAGKA